MQQLIENIEQWGNDSNLIHGSTPQKQMLKLMEKFGELCGGIVRNNPEMIKDAIGDCFVVLTILNAQYRHRNTRKRDREEFHQVMLTPAGLYRHKNISEAALTAMMHFSKCYTGDFIPSDWDIHNGVNALESIARLVGVDIKDCVIHAYDQIKDRKGEMRDGIWIKNEDL